MPYKKTILGVMSGTSLDGLDLALCQFNQEQNNYTYKIIKADCIPYPQSIKDSLTKAPFLNGRELLLLDKQYGQYIAEHINHFIADKEKPDYIASHGHTIFHEPDKHFTLQIGCGAEIAGHTNIPVVYNFRRSDTALGGQGAPLVPCGDKLLFSDYTFCLNIGGFSNISYDNAFGQRIAFDICPSNIVLNELAQEAGFPYDKGGKIAASGSLHRPLSEQLNQIPYYQELPPKSLGREYVETYFRQLINNKSIPVADRLHTYTLHIAQQIASSLKDFSKGKLLITGGGAYNTHLINQLRHLTKHEVIVPDQNLIEYKEALIFAFLAYLRIQNKPNVLSSVTGASRDNIAGMICHP